MAEEKIPSGLMRVESVRHWDVVEHLQSEAGRLAYLNAAFEDGDPALITAALSDISRALGRESLHKALSAEGHPEFATIMKVLEALGLRLHASAAAPVAH